MDVILSKFAQKYFILQDNVTKKRLKSALEKLSNEPPIGDIQPLKGKDNYWRLRVGDLRIIFTKIDSVIYIAKIAPRGQAYNN